MAKATGNIEGFDIEPTTEALPTRRVPFSAELADRLFAVASANVNGACNGIVYSGEDDETYKEHTSLFRRALQSRLDSKVKRARIVNLPQSDEENAPIKFSVVIRDYNPRGPRNTGDADEADTEQGDDVEDADEA